MKRRGVALFPAMFYGTSVYILQIYILGQSYVHISLNIIIFYTKHELTFNYTYFVYNVIQKELNLCNVHACANAHAHKYMS